MTEGKGTDGYSKSRVRQALFHFLVGKAFAGISNFLVLVLLVRSLDSNEYGVYVALLAILAIVLSLSSLGLEPTVERFLPEVKLRYPDGLKPLVLAGLYGRAVALVIACVIVSVLMPQIAGAFGLVEWVGPARMFVAVVFLTGIMNSLITVFDALLLQKMSQLTVASYAVARLASACVLVFLTTPTVQGAVTMEILASATGLGAGLTLLMKSGIRLSPIGLFSDVQQNLKRFRERMIRFGCYNYVAQFLMHGYSTETFRLLVTRVLGLTETARYGLAGSLVELVNRYLPAFLLVRLIRPIFVSRYTENRDFAQINSFGNIIFKLNLFLIAPLVSSALLIGDQVIGLLTAGRLPSDGYVLVASMVILVPMSHQWVISVIATTLERNDLQAKGAIVASIGLPVALLSMPTLGVWGAFLGTYISAAVYNVYAIWFLRRHGFDYRQDLLGIIKIFVSALMAWWAVSLLGFRLDGFKQVIAVSAAVGAVYSVIATVLKPFREAERDMINSVLPKKVFIF